MTEQYLPGYRDPDWEGSPAEEIENIPDCEHDENDRCSYDEPNLNAEIIREGIERFGDDETKRLMDLASDLMDQFLLILEEGDDRVKDLGDEEYRFLIALIRDGFDDSTDD